MQKPVQFVDVPIQTFIVLLHNSLRCVHQNKVRVQDLPNTILFVYILNPGLGLMVRGKELGYTVYPQTSVRKSHPLKNLEPSWLLEGIVRDSRAYFEWRADKIEGAE